MLKKITIEEIDQLLDELEQLANPSSSRQRFFDAVLERLGYVLHAAGTAILFRAASQQWIVVAHRGERPAQQFADLPQPAPQQVDYLCSADRRMLAVPARRGGRYPRMAPWSPVCRLRAATADQ